MNRVIPTRLSVSARNCYKAACRLKFMEPGHPLEEEKEQYIDFRYDLSFLNTRESGSKVASDKGIWYSKLVRYENRKQKDKYLLGQKGDIFWDTTCVCISTAIQDLTHLMLRVTSLPICVMMGQRVKGTNYGHTCTLVIKKEENGWKAWLKNPLPFNDASVPSFAYKILRGIHIETVILIRELPNEEHVFATNCMKEGYKVVADVLDGVFVDFAGRLSPQLTKEYKVSSKKQIA